MTPPADSPGSGRDPFDGEVEGAAFAAARAELDRLRALGERLGRLGAQTADLGDREKRAAIQDANLAAFEQTSAYTADLALTRMRDLLTALRDTPAAAAGAEALRERIDAAARDIAAARDSESADLARRIARILAQAGGAAAPSDAPSTASSTAPAAPRDEGPDFEPFEG